MTISELFNNELVKNYKKNNKEYFDVTITILFKQNIQSTEQKCSID